MKKLPFIVGLILVLSLMFVSATITSVTQNIPLSNQETKVNTLLFNVTVVWTTANTNITNVTWYRDGTQFATNGTINGTKTSPTAGDFTFNVDVSGLSSGSYSIIAEARNSSEVSQGANSLNSSAVTLIIDRTATTVVIEIDRGIVAPFKAITLDCGTNRGTTDANTLNTTSFNLFVTDPDGVTTNSSPTSGTAEFSGDTLSIKGEYTAGCSIMDNAGNRGSTNTLFRVSDNANEIQKGAEQAKQFRKGINRTMLYAFAGLLFLLVVVVLIIIMISVSKRRK